MGIFLKQKRFTLKHEVVNMLEFSLTLTQRTEGDKGEKTRMHYQAL